MRRPASATRSSGLRSRRHPRSQAASGSSTESASGCTSRSAPAARPGRTSRSARSPRSAPQPGEPLVIAKVRNSGRRTLDISGTLALSGGPGGLRAGPFPVKLRTALAPGRSDQVTVRLDRRLPRGPWRARMRLRSGTVQRVAVANLTFPRVASAAKPPLARGNPPGSHYLVLAILGVLLSIGALVLLRFRRALWGRGNLGARTA